MSKPVLAAVLFVVAVLAVIGYSTVNLMFPKYRVEVCMAFHGHTDCRIARGDSEEHALRAATSNACALIASGMTDSMACEHSQPVTVKWLKK